MANERDKKVYLLSAETIKKLEAQAEAGGAMIPDPVQFETLERAGKKHFRLRPGSDKGGLPPGVRPRSFFPTVRGTTLTVGPGSVMFVEVRKRSQDGLLPPPRSIEPIFPTFEGTAIFPGPAEKDVTGLTGGSLWLIIPGDLCTSQVIAPGAANPNRVVLAAKDSAPDADDGEVRVLLSRFDLETSGAGLALTNFEPYRLSDLEWTFSCEFPGDDDPSDDESLDGTDPDGSSGPTPPEPAPSSAPDPDPDPVPDPACLELVTIDAQWSNKPSCYDKSPFGSRKVPVDIVVSVTLGGDLCDVCPNWWADAWLEKGRPINEGSANVQPDKSVRWPIGCGDRRLLSFEVDPFTPCEKLFFRVRVKSSPPADPSDSGPCCDYIFSQDWLLPMPPYCGESCSTVV